MRWEGIVQGGKLHRVHSSRVRLVAILQARGRGRLRAWITCEKKGWYRKLGPNVQSSIMNATCRDLCI